MEIDKTTLSDLLIFDREEEFSVFSKINFTCTSRGKEQLRKNLMQPLNSIQKIEDVQACTDIMHVQKQHWPKIISNGTIMVVEKYFETNIDPIPQNPTVLSAMSYKIINSHDYTLVKYSLQHCYDFIKGMGFFVQNYLKEETPIVLKKELEEAKKIIANEKFVIIFKTLKATELIPRDMLALANFIRYRFKMQMHELLQIYGKLDAWNSMAIAKETLNLCTAKFVDTKTPYVQAKALYHFMLTKPVPYDVLLNEETNFLFLTGANMAGKSTFIKACGTAVYLAHTGMGVPAKDIQLGFFDGILSNINVIDNIARGESYFFNEVQRIKSTVQKINDGKKWLILIDELFKGTNVQDAMKCSTAVVEGLLKNKNSVFILSTHLYEIGEDLKKYNNLRFNYFETTVANDQLSFSYLLKEGISNDRLGYLILKREGVVKMLEEI
jgi:DNA mismatch repair protein MutS